MGVLLAAVAAAVYGLADYCGGRSSRHADSVSVTFWAEAAGLLVVAAVLPFSSGDGWPPAGDVGWGVATAAAASVGLVCFYRALAGGSMTVVAPVTAVVSAVLPVVVGLAQGERPSGVSLIGCGVAAVAIALVSGAGSPGDRHVEQRVLVLAVVAGVGFAMVFVFLDAASGTSGMWPVAVARFASLPMLAGTARVSRVGLAIPRRIWPIVAVGGVCDMTANVLYLASTGHGMLAVVAVITALYPVSTVALAYLLDGERVSRAQGFGLILAVSALAMVGAGEAGGSAHSESDEVGEGRHAEVGEMDPVRAEQVRVVFHHRSPVEDAVAGE